MTDNRQLWLAVRVGLAALTAFIIVGGVASTKLPPQDPHAAADPASAHPLVVIALLLLPALLFLIGIRTPRWVVVFGSLLVGITAVAWAYYTTTRDSVAPVAMALAWIYTFLASVVGTCVELGGRARRNRQRHLGRLGGEALPQLSGEEARPRQRAW